VTETEPEKLWYATDNLAVINADGTKARILTKNYDRMVQQPEFSANGRNIYFTADDSGNKPLMQIAVKSGKLINLTQGDIVVSGYDIHVKNTITTI
jgi:hypothetical protein